jgi:putative DNA primase/helicase
VTAAEIAARLGSAEREGKGWRCKCPAHDDHDPSLGITEKAGKVLFRCWAGCEQDAVLAALRQRGLWPQKEEERRSRAKIVATYGYRDADNVLRYQVVRLSPKSFYQRRPNGSPDSFINNMDGVGALPYRLPELLAAPEATVFVCEGEKDVVNLFALGVVATCNHGGAGKWRPEISHWLAGRDVVILPDNDAKGRKHAPDVARKLSGIAARIRIVELPNLPDKGDVSNWLEAGGTLEELYHLADAAEPVASPKGNGTSPSGDAEVVARVTLQIGSDVEIAGRVAEDLHGSLGQVIFCDGRFWHYEISHWKAVEEHELRTAVHRYDGALYVTPMHSTEAVKLSKNRVTSVLHEMGAMRARPDFFVDAAIGINCSSGFIAFAADGSPQLQPHRPEHRCRHVLPGTWRADINAVTPPTNSLLARLLNGVFQGDPDAIDKHKLLAEVAGSAALGYATKLQQPKAVIFKGEAAENGKSQILDLIRGLLPVSAIASVTAAKMGDERFIVGLAGKLLNAADELSASSAVASDTFKAVITGEPVSGRDVYESAVTFRPVAQHVFATNALPTFSGGMDRGVQRRLLVVTFNRVIRVEERIEQIGIRVGEEEPDLLLAWAVAGAARLIQQRGLTVPPSSATALQNWLYGADPVLAWVQARVDEATPSPPGQRIVGIKSSYAHSLFRQWALNEGFRDSTIPAVNGFVQRLQANKAIPGVAVRHTKSGNWLTGLTILATDRDPKDDDIQEAAPVHPSGIDFNG